MRLQVENALTPRIQCAGGAFVLTRGAVIVGWKDRVSYCSGTFHDGSRQLFCRVRRNILISQLEKIMVRHEP